MKTAIWAARRWSRAWVASWVLAFGAGAQASTPQTGTVQAPSPCEKAAATAEPYRWTGYSDKLVDACLGPNHYRIPAHYFDNQIGPDFQGNFILAVQWPDLQPLPPGRVGEGGMKAQYKAVSIHPYYVDRVPIETRLQKSIEYGNLDRLSERDAQPLRFGLTPYFVSPQKFEQFSRERDRAQGFKSDWRLEHIADWYLAYDAEGRLTTVIKCDSHLEPLGLVQEGDRLVDDGSPRTSLCSHEIVIEDSKLRVTIDYQRVLLKDWKRFEDRARELFARFRVR